jgi:hypothetical protein
LRSVDILCGEQHAEQISVVAGASRAPPPDDTVDDVVEQVFGGQEAPVSWQRQLAELWNEHEEGGAKPRHDGFDGWDHVSRVACNVRAEESARNDVERQTHHVYVQVSHLTRFPCCKHPVGALDHLLGVDGDAVTVERGLRQAALPTPEVAFAREEPITNDTTKVAQERVLYETLVSADEDVLDVGRVRNEIARQPRETELDQVPVAARDALKKTE